MACRRSAALGAAVVPLVKSCTAIPSGGSSALERASDFVASARNALRARIRWPGSGLQTRDALRVAHDVRGRDAAQQGCEVGIGEAIVEGYVGNACKRGAEQRDGRGFAALIEQRNVRAALSSRCPLPRLVPLAEERGTTSAVPHKRGRCVRARHRPPSAARARYSWLSSVGGRQRLRVLDLQRNAGDG